MHFAQFIISSVDSCVSHAFGLSAFGSTLTEPNSFRNLPDRSNGSGDWLGHVCRISHLRIIVPACPLVTVNVWPLAGGFVTVPLPVSTIVPLLPGAMATVFVDAVVPS